MSPRKLEARDRFIEMLLERDLGEARRAIEEKVPIPDVEVDLAEMTRTAERGQHRTIIVLLIVGLIAAIVVYQCTS